MSQTMYNSNQQLFPQHRKDLKKSGLSQETIREAGLFSVDKIGFQKLFGRIFSKLKSALIFPYGGNYFRAKLFPSLTFKENNKTKKIKYYQKTGTPCQFYFQPQLDRSILSDPTKPIVICEGEKKTLLFTQRTNLSCIGIGGVWSWLNNHRPLLDFEKIEWKERQVTYIPDSDAWDKKKPQVFQAVFAFCKELESRGAKIEVVVIKSKKHKKVGLDDYFKTHSLTDFYKLPRITTEDEIFDPVRVSHEQWKGKNESKIATEDLPAFDISETHIPTLTSKLWDIIQTANAKLPTIFRFGNLMCRIEKDDNDAPFIQTLDEDKCLCEISRLAKYFIFKTTQNQTFQIPVRPTPAIVKALLATPDKPLPILRRIVTAPVFASNGSIQLQPGYCFNSQTLYAPLRSLSVPKVSPIPTKQEIERAKSLIFGDLLVDFPFVGQADLAHAVVLLFSIPVRSLIDGPVPLICVTAPSQGTGKGLLCEITSHIFTDTITKITETKDEDEWRKRIFAALRISPAVVQIDNVKNRLESSTLESVLTTDYFADRILCTSQISNVPVRNVWCATGNNMQFGSEMARRVVLIRLNAKSEQPWRKEDFKHSNIRNWAKLHRGELIWAALTLIQSWIFKGKPQGRKTLGSYESWVGTMGGILESLEIPGFLENQKDFYEEADIERQTFIPFVRAWFKVHGNRSANVGNLLEIARTTLLDFESGSERSLQTKLGFFLKKIEGRIFESLTVEKCNHASGFSMWRLTKTASSVSEPSEPFFGTNTKQKSKIGETGKMSTKVPKPAFLKERLKKLQPTWQRAKRRI